MKEYKVDIAGLEHTVQLSDEDAKARGLTGGEQSDSGDASTKARATTKNKGA